MMEKILQFLADIIPKDKKLILFGSYTGRFRGDNSWVLYKYMKNKDFKCIWVDNRKSLKAIWLSLRANLVVTSHGYSDVLLFPPNKYPKELYLHHGIASIRKQIFRESGKCSLDRFKKIEMSIATSDWVREQQMKNVPVPNTVITGYPRTDILFKFIILYAPTWRKKDIEFFPFPDRDLREIIDFLKKRNIKMLLRPHHTNLKRVWEDEIRKSDVFETNTIEDDDTSDLLKKTDCLITDYSSVLFDYLAVDKPVVFLPYDMEDYKREWGGFNYSYDKITVGPCPRTQKEFLRCIDKIHKGEDEFREKRRELRNTVFKHQDGNSCERIYELIKEKKMKKPVDKLSKFSIIKEFWEFMKVRKKWWLIPIIIFLLLLGALIILLEGSALAPFIYTLF